MAAAKPGIEASVMEGWLRDMGCDPVRTGDESSNWRFDLVFPPTSSHKLFVVNPKQPPRAILVVSGAVLSPAHLAAFDSLGEDARREFVLDLQEALNRDHVECTIQGVTASSIRPSGFQVMGIIFDDGLSLDALALRMSAVYKAELAGILCVTRRLAPRSDPAPGAPNLGKYGVQ
ncbi:MAG TPA: DUF2299 family protein [Steroidobacteraceae bacterium]|nr:DUF2299 family protein [Steroidobacteraceae bacterium]